jgi:hypothetical protein
MKTPHDDKEKERRRMRTPHEDAKTTEQRSCPGMKMTEIQILFWIRAMRPHEISVMGGRGAQGTPPETHEAPPRS